MSKEDLIIEQLLMLHNQLVRIAYNAGGGSNEVLAELARVKMLKDAILRKYEK